MIIKMEVPDEIINAFNRRFGFERQNAKDALSQQDFYINTIGTYTKDHAGNQLADDAVDIATQNAKSSIDNLKIEKRN